MKTNNYGNPWVWSHLKCILEAVLAYSVSSRQDSHVSVEHMIQDCDLGTEYLYHVSLL